VYQPDARQDEQTQTPKPLKAYTLFNSVNMTVCILLPAEPGAFMAGAFVMWRGGFSVRSGAKMTVHNLPHVKVKCSLFSLLKGYIPLCLIFLLTMYVIIHFHAT